MSAFGNTQGFGSNTQQQPASVFGSSVFGTQPSTNTNFANAFNQSATPAAPTGIFGNNQQQQPSTSGIFGNNQQQPSTSSGIFGNTQNQQQQPAAPGGIFGNNQNQQQPATNSGIFGNFAAQNQPSVFGNTQNSNQQGSGGGVFGSGAQQPAASSSVFGNNSNMMAQSTGGMFGNNATMQPNGQQANGGVFGNATGTNNSSGLFGNKPGGIFGSTNPASGSGTSIFGSSTNQTQQQQPQTTSGLFGSTNQNQPSTGLFGSTNQNQSSTGLFGSTSNTGATGSLFGNKPQQPGLFGSTVGNPFSASTLPSNSLLSSRVAMTPAQQQADATAQTLHIQQRIELIYNAWNPASPQCRFQYYFYNLVNPNQVSLYTRPDNAKNDALWEQALRENPDPTSHVPVLAIGFDDLRTRVEAQNRKAEEHQQHLKELKSRIEALTSQHALSNSSRLLRATATQTQLAQRLLRFVQHLHLLIPSVRSSSIRPEEERLRSTLEEVEDELRRGRVKGKLNELWAHLGAVNAAKERVNTGTGEWAVVDEDGLAHLAQILSEQQAGLAHVTKILQKALKDVGVIMGTNTGGAQADYEVDNLLNSTFRTSSLR